MSTAEFEKPASDQLANLFALQKFDDDDFDEVATASRVLPRLQLFSFNSNEVKEDRIKAGNYGIVTMKGQPVIDLTPVVDVLLICWRPKALDMSSDTIISIFDVTNPMFKEISLKSEDQDSGCMFGPEFLVYVPAIEKFATFFCGSKTARREAVNLKPLLTKFATLKSVVIKKGRYTWHSPKVFECSTLNAFPEMDEIKQHADDFNNPPVREVEPVEAAAGGGRAR